MNATVRVDRMQYGIGQGGFHAQQIRVASNVKGVEIESYRFVYDCGSDTAAIKTGQPKPLVWAIQHFAENDDLKRADKLRVDSLYLSHFQKDHIDGARRLAELVDLKEIVIPYLSREQLLHILGQQISSGALTALTPDVQEYLAVLGRAAGDGPIIDGVPTTRVRPGGEPTGPAGGNDARPELQLGDIGAGDYRLGHQGSVGTAWGHTASRLMHIQTGKVGSRVSSDFWELRVWSYAQDAALSNAVVAALSALNEAPGKPALTQMVQGIVDLNEMAWAIKHRKEIQDAYEKALKSQGVTPASDHNVVSLCLHSGPTDSMTYDSYRPYGTEACFLQCLIGHSKASSWLGTGDAQLERRQVWADFYGHFTQDGIDRLQQWQTVLMPHHGSGSGGNFNADLLKGPVQHAVFSAGAFNKFRHPSRRVLEAVADTSTAAVIVTEFSRPGFFESLTYSLCPTAWGSW